MSVMYVFCISSIFHTATADFLKYKFYDSEGGQVITDEIRLHNDLFATERKSFPNVKPLNLKFGLSLKAIVDYDASGEGIVISSFIRQEWKNPSITWKPEHYGGITEINVRPEKTWIPDIYVHGNVEAQFKYNGLLDKMKTSIIVSSDGSHYWLAPIVMEVGCGMNVNDFPFDTQRCPLLFYSMTYDTARLNLVPQDIDKKGYAESSEWVYISMNHTEEAVRFPGSDSKFSQVTYTIVLKRKPLHVLMNVVVPNIALCILGLMVFVQSITAGERCVYTVTILLALSWYVTAALDYLPSGSEGVPLSQIFLGMSLFALVITQVLISFSISAHYAHEGNKTMPKLLRKYVLEKLGRYLGYQQERKVPPWRIKSNAIKGTDAMFSDINHFPMHIIKNKGLLRSEISNYNSSIDSLISSSRQSIPSSLSELKNVTGVESLEKHLDVLLKRFEDEDDSRWTKHEWKTLARIMDHVFVWFFCCFYGAIIIYASLFVLHIH